MDFNSFLDQQKKLYQEQKSLVSDTFNERELHDEYPVYIGYLYVCDGEVKSCPIHGIVSDLKKELNVTHVTTCDAKRLLS